ncbi:MAG: SEC59/DGK1/VTE5 family protein [Xenococcaceae cyanobacterium MO_188.B19]|nr:SEC59/DGK1/VTE5 family protein [Xenococcaceae cyanobacterium MO_188.B19]
MTSTLTSYFNQSFYPLTIIFVYLVILVIISETLNRFINNDPELTRKVVHIGSGNVILLAWWLHIPGSIIVAAAVIASIIALTSYFLPILPSINSVGRKSLGTLFYAISIGILAQVFWQDYPQYTALGILVMAWGDGMAAIIGQRFGKHSYRVFDINKSWEGSLAMAFASFIVTSLILVLTQGNTPQTYSIAAIVAIIATALEAFSKLGIDNLTVPLGSASLCYFCSQVFLSI